MNVSQIILVRMNACTLLAFYAQLYENCIFKFAKM